MFEPAFTNTWRFHALLLIVPGFALLAAQLWWIHVKEAPLLREVQVEARRHEVTLPAVRGKILDSEGRILAHTDYVWDITLDPVAMTEAEDAVAWRRTNTEVGKTRGMTKEARNEVYRKQLSKVVEMHDLMVIRFAQLLGETREKMDGLCKIRWFIPAEAELRKIQEAEARMVVEKARAKTKEDTSPRLRESPFSLFAISCRYLIEKTNMKKDFLEAAKKQKEERPSRAKPPAKYNVANRNIFLATDLDYAQAQKFATALGELEKEQKAKIRGIEIKEREIRGYPQGNVAAQIIGLLSKDGTPVMGVEKAMNKHLTGIEGNRRSQKDSRGTELPVHRKTDQKAVNGDYVKLTLDCRIQEICEEQAAAVAAKHKPRGITILVSEPVTGKLRAFVNWPSFDRKAKFIKKAQPPAADTNAATTAQSAAASPPPPPDGANNDGNGAAVSANADNSTPPPSHYHIRGITDAHEPGSVFKIISIGAALNEGVITPDDVFYTGHREKEFFSVFRGIERSLPAEDYGPPQKTVRDIIRKSSNRGAVLAVMRMTEVPNDETLFHEYAKHFGIGSQTGIWEALDGDPRRESAGVLRDPRLRDKKKTKNPWNDSTITRMPIGHAVSTTAIQMHYAMSVIANDGKLMKPLLIENITRLATDENPKDEVTFQSTPTQRHAAIKPQTARLMAHLLREVCRDQKDGTGRRAESKDYEPAGKTGTTKKTGTDGKYISGKYVSSFCGFFPFESPRYVISVIVDEPTIPLPEVGGHAGLGGGAVAAPAFRKIMEKMGETEALKIPLATAPAPSNH